MISESNELAPATLANTANLAKGPSSLFTTHLARLKTSLQTNSNATLSDFITAHTFLNGKPFSFSGHEYQKDILNDTSQNIVIKKSAQIGISEMSSRLAVSRCAMINGYSAIYTLPSALAAQAFMKSRINPLVDGSPYLRSAVSGDNDSASVKQFRDSFLWLKGCQVDRQAISTPADLLLFDEVDNSDQDVMTLYESRIIHSSYKHTVKLSTPTIPQYGISAAFDTSRRKFHHARCTSCSQWFLPNYSSHVKIPGYSNDLFDIKKSDFSRSDFLWHEAYVQCPSCHKPVDLRLSQREWVVENPDDAFFDSGYHVGPFSCPTVISPADIVKSFVTFERPVDFYNQRLGEDHASSESSLLEDELKSTIIAPGLAVSSPSTVIGLDMGSTCWAVVASVGLDDALTVLHTEAIPAHKVVDRVQQLVQQFRSRMVVVDRHPLTEAVYQIQSRIANSFAAIFTTSNSIEMFRVSDKEENLEKGVSGMRQVNINKDVMMDVLMGLLRAGSVRKVSCPHDSDWVAQLQDNKRLRMFKNNEMRMTWVKTTGNDHLHMAIGYALVASRILGVGRGTSAPLPLVSTFRLKPPA